MNSFKYNESHKADRFEILKSPLSLTKLIEQLKNFKGMSKELRATFALLICTGGRASEICNLKQKDIVFYDYSGKELPHDKILLTDTAKIIVTMDNKKNRKQHSKKIPVTKNELFLEPIEWIIDRVNELGYNPEGKIYTKGRKCLWFSTKKWWGKNFFIHLFRHFYITAHASSGVSVPVIRRLAGWSSTAPFATYEHIEVGTLSRELEKAYGKELKNVGDPNRPLTHAQAIGAFAAAKELREIQIGPHNQKKSIFTKEDGKLDAAPLPEGARRIRDQIRANNPAIAEKAKQELLTARTVIAEKKPKPIEPQKEQVDLSTLVSIV
jgi:hypothetical protein